MRRTHAERFNVNQAPDNNVRSFTANGTVGGNLDWRYTRPRSNGSFSLRLGADGAVNRVHIQLIEESPTDPADQTLNTDVRSPSYDIAGYALADLRLDKVTFSGGFRYDEIHIPFEDELDPSADTTSTFRRLSPRGGVSLEVGPAPRCTVRSARAFGRRRFWSWPAPTRPPPVRCRLRWETIRRSIRWWPRRSRSAASWCAGPPIMNALGVPHQRPGRHLVHSVGERRVRGLLRQHRLYPAGGGRARRPGHPQRAAFALRQLRLHPGHVPGSRPRSSASGPTTPSSALRCRAGTTSRPGDRMPLVPDHQVKFGGLLSLTDGLQFGLDVRYTGRAVASGRRGQRDGPAGRLLHDQPRAGFSRAQLGGLGGAVATLSTRKGAIFGTFNENRQTGALERFLTPMNARSLKVVVRRAFGG